MGCRKDFQWHNKLTHILQEDAGLDDELYKDLKHIVSEAKNLTREAYEESLRRQKAERDLHEVVQKVRL